VTQYGVMFMMNQLAKLHLRWSELQSPQRVMIAALKLESETFLCHYHTQIMTCKKYEVDH
jgi:hypothetical protein